MFQRVFQRVFQRARRQQRQQNKRPWKPSQAYRQWRREFVQGRLKLAVWIAIAAQLFLLTIDLFIIEPLTHLSKDAVFVWSDYSQNFQGFFMSTALLILFLLWIKRPHSHREAINQLAFFPFATLIAPEVFQWLTFSDTIDSSILIYLAIVFLCQAIAVPVQWRAHLFSQGVTLLFILGFWGWGLQKNPVIMNDTAILTGARNTLYFTLVLTVSNITVGYSERLLHREFELKEQLKKSLQTVSKELQQPILHNQQLLQSIQSANRTSPDPQQIIIPHNSVQQLLANSNHQIAMLNALLREAATRD